MDGRQTHKDSTHAIVRRRERTTAQPLAAPFTSDLYPPTEHLGRGFRVQSELVWPLITEQGELRGPPQVRLRWHHDANADSPIAGFRRTGGFGVDGDHGQRIVNSRSDGEKVEALDPGDYYYTFCTYSSFLSAIRVYGNELQFSVAVPSIERVLQLMRQAIEFRKLEQEYRKITAPAANADKPERAVKRFEREFTEAIGNVGARTQATERLAREWAERKRAIEAGPYTEAERKRMLRRLARIMRDLREQFEL